MSGRMLSAGGFARSVASVLAGLALTAVIMRVSGYDALAAFRALGAGATGLMAGPPVSPTDLALGSMHLSRFMLAQSLARVTPLLFTGLAVAIGLRAGLFNIGAPGQMILGALAAGVVGTRCAGLPPSLHVGLVLLSGILAGGLWGALTGLLKAVRGVHEVLTTIMLNYVAANLATYLVTHNLKDPGSMAAQTTAIAPSAWLTPFIPGGNLTAGLLIAVAAAAALAFVIRRTALGFTIRAVGLGPRAALAAGIPVARVLVVTMFLSGALAGLAGAVEVMGVHHRYVTGVEGSYGFDGIAVALLGGLSGGGVALSALFFGALANGASFMQIQTNVPDTVATIVQAVVIIFVGLRFLPKRSVTAGPAHLPSNPKEADAHA